VEIWKQIENFPNYEISTYGKVRRFNSGPGTYAGRVLKPHIWFGYLRVGLMLNAKQIFKPVHSLVLETFIGPRPEKHQCNHKDGNKQNNHISNLEWVTPSLNQKHAYDLGLREKLKGEKNGRAKLTLNEARLVRSIAKSRLIPQREIAKMFGISPVTVSAIKMNRIWKQLQQEEEE